MIFYIFAILAVLSGTYMVLTRNLLYAGFSLLVTLLSLAGIYVLLFADFVAVTQLMVYVGGVLVLILFGIMLSTRVNDNSVLSENVNKVWGTLIALMLFIGLSYTIWETDFETLPWLQNDKASIVATQESTIYTIGIKLMTDFVLPFEVASLLLLIALIGAAYIATNNQKV